MFFKNKKRIFRKNKFLNNNNSKNFLFTFEIVEFVIVFSNVEEIKVENDNDNVEIVDKIVVLNEIVFGIVVFGNFVVCVVIVDVVGVSNDFFFKKKYIFLKPI